MCKSDYIGTFLLLSSFGHNHKLLPQREIEKGRKEKKEREGSKTRSHMVTITRVFISQPTLVVPVSLTESSALGL